VTLGLDRGGWLRRGVAALALLMTLALALAQLATGGIVIGEIECCCGTHAGDAPCGCPDCPVAHGGHGHDGARAAHHGDSDAPPVTSFRACGAEGHLVDAPAFPPFLPLPAIAVADVPHRLEPAPPPAPLPPSHLSAPPAAPS
jgi:hypothetical protein